MAVHHHEIRDFERTILEMHYAAAPPNGAPFHNPDDLDFFRATNPDEYRANDEVREALSRIEVIAALFGVAGSGKDTAKMEAMTMASRPRYRDSIPDISLVTAGTTRSPQFRNGRVEEDGIDYDFYHAFDLNVLLRGMLERREFVQFAIPRPEDGHVYFTEAKNYPDEGIALLDTVPSSFFHIANLMEGTSTRVTAIYRAFPSMEILMDQMMSRGDLLKPDGTPVDPKNFQARMQEGANSTAYALEMGDQFSVFVAEEKPEAGKAVLEILMGRHSADMQKRGRAALDCALREYKRMEIVPNI